MITLNEKSSGNVNGTQILFPHLCTGIDVLLLVAITFTCDNDQEIVSVTHNGNTLAKKIASQIQNEVRTEIWYLVSPNASGNIQVDFNNTTKAICVAQSADGVNQSTPFYFETSAAAKNTDTIPITFQMINGNMIFACGIANGNQEANVEVWQTEMWDILYENIRSQGIASFPNVTGSATVSNSLNEPGDLSMAILGVNAA